MNIIKAILDKGYLVEITTGRDGYYITLKALFGYNTQFEKKEFCGTNLEKALKQAHNACFKNRKNRV
jgi:hypothetical protein